MILIILRNKKKLTWQYETINSANNLLFPKSLFKGLFKVFMHFIHIFFFSKQLHEWWRTVSLVCVAVCNHKQRRGLCPLLNSKDIVSHLPNQNNQSRLMCFQAFIQLNLCGKVKNELRVQIHELQVQIYQLRVQIYELED